jgi:hypothetical protein
VQALPSSHVPAIGVNSQPTFESQESCVHGFWSSQIRGPPMQILAMQPSFFEQASPSLQGLALATPLHAPVASQLSSVQGLPSSHDLIAPGLQVLPAQASLTVQALPSSQAAVLAA